MASDNQIRTAEDLDAALRALFRRWQSRALPESLRNLADQLEGASLQRAREDA